MKLIRYILLPVVPIYYLVASFIDWAYTKGVFKSKSYNFPLICVGNLSVGGTGKSPMIEYLISLLSAQYKLATLSRGYKRHTKGFVLASKSSTVLTLGDEPFQFYNKFKDVYVGVDANRQNGITQLRMQSPKPDVILLDDAFQHRKVNAGLNVLLTPYYSLYSDDFMLPTGNLRVPKNAAKRAQIIVVTKCPETLSTHQQEAVVLKLNPLPNQKVYFSAIKYSDFVLGKDGKLPLQDLQSKSLTLVTGIANATPLVNYLTAKGLQFEHLKFNDHHEFTVNEIYALRKKSFILTTEKDYMRLNGKLDTTLMFYLPITVSILNTNDFDTVIKNYVVNAL